MHNLKPDPVFFFSFDGCESCTGEQLFLYASGTRDPPNSIPFRNTGVRAKWERNQFRKSFWKSDRGKRSWNAINNFWSKRKIEISHAISTLYCKFFSRGRVIFIEFESNEMAFWLHEYWSIDNDLWIANCVFNLTRV